MSLLQPPCVKAQQVQPRADATAGVPGGAEEKEERKLPARKRDPGDADRGLFTHFHKLRHLFLFFLRENTGTSRVSKGWELLSTDRVIAEVKLLQKYETKRERE